MSALPSASTPSSAPGSPGSPSPLLSRLHHQLQLLTPDELAELLAGLDQRNLDALLYDWAGTWARDSQLLPGPLATGDWFVWLLLAGRGFGKTRTMAEAVRHLVEAGQARRIALVAPTAADARDTMVEGESGLLAVCPPWAAPKYEPSKRRLTWPNGARATLFSAEEPERLRGPQHDLAWGDEPASWADEGKPAWDNLVMGLRLGGNPRALISGTPKPVKLVLELLRDPRTALTRGNTFENAANLAHGFIEQVRRTYAGTRLGRQEIYAEVLTDVLGALFNQEHVDRHRVAVAPELSRVIVSVDPSPTSLHGSDETGIMVVGKGPPPPNWEGKVDGEHAYVLRDWTMKGSPDEWARQVVKAYYTHKADRIVAEVNNGGEMVETIIHSVDPDVPFTAVRAMRGKSKRAEPVAALFEQGKVHLVGTDFEKLERQLRVFTGVNGKRDDRCDSMNWGIHELMLSGSGFVFV